LKRASERQDRRVVATSRFRQNLDRAGYHIASGSLQQVKGIPLEQPNDVVGRAGLGIRGNSVLRIAAGF
jgi:hypothetical protein